MFLRAFFKGRFLNDRTQSIVICLVSTQQHQEKQQPFSNDGVVGSVKLIAYLFEMLITLRKIIQKIYSCKSFLSICIC